MAGVQRIHIPLVVPEGSRDGTLDKDSKMVNVYGEVDKGGDYHLYRRPGMKQLSNPPAQSGVEGMGVYYWNGNVYSIFDGKLYKNGVDTTYTVDTSGGKYSFNSIMGSNPRLVMQNGAKGYSYDDVGGLSSDLHSISASYPEYTCKGIAYLDGTTYVLQHFFGTQITPATIWGSKIDSVDQSDSWDPLNFITARIEPDSGVYLTKQLVYVVCLKEWTTEFFFDAGNATGSPLKNMQTNKLPYGCASADSVQRIGDTLMWISTNRDASNQIIMVDGTHPSIVSTQAIDRMLDKADLSTVYSWQMKCDGHTYYVVTVKEENLTLAYDIEQRLWYNWTDQNGDCLSIVDSCRDSAGNWILQDVENGFLYYSGSNYPDDDGNLIPIEVVTPEVAGGTFLKKQMSLLTVWGDQVPGSTMYLQFSDDNYQTWSQPRLIDMSMKMPNIINCGTFRRRAFRLTVGHNLPWRVQSMEAQVSLGVN